MGPGPHELATVRLRRPPRSRGRVEAPPPRAGQGALGSAGPLGGNLRGPGPHRAFAL